MLRVIEKLFDRLGGMRREVVDDAVQLDLLGALRDEVRKERDEVFAAGRVGHPPVDASIVDLEGGEQHRGSVTDILELLSSWGAGNRRLGEVLPVAGDEVAPPPTKPFWVVGGDGFEPPTPAL
jgi:hypothetical protein